MQLYRRAKEIEDAGGHVVLIGQGSPRHAAHFRRRQEIDFPVLADEDVVSYKAVGTKRGGAKELLSPSVVAKGLARAVRSRDIQGRPVGDVQRLGGVVIVRPGGEVAWSYMAKDAADNADIDEIVRHTRA